MALADDDDGFPGRFDPAAMICCTSSYPMTCVNSTPKCRLTGVNWRRLAGSNAVSAGVTGSPRSWARGGLPSPIFTAVLLVIATTGLLLSVFAPVTQERSALDRRSARWPIPSTPPGTMDGLLPDVQLVDGFEPAEHARDPPGRLHPRSRPAASA